MKKKLAIILFSAITAACCVFGLSACGSGNGAEDKNDSISPCIHTYGEPVDLISNCTTHLVSQSCTKCGDTQVTTAPTIAHIPGDLTCDDSDHWRVCSVCQGEVDKVTHNINEQNVCTDCGYVKNATVGLEYAYYNGYYAVSGIGTATDTDIVVPSYYQGLPVKGIGASVFRDCSSLKSLTIPDSVTSIGNYAFSGCSGLTGITIPASVISIGDYAFSGCSGFANITVESGNTIYHSAGNCLVETASKTLIVGCKNSVIPDDGNVISIGDGAFCNCSSLTSITIPDSVTSISGGAFSGCSSLESITLPFVGGPIKSASDTYQYPFGYIFGTNSYTGGTATMQQYINSPNSVSYTTYYIPSSLKSVTITGGSVLYGAFWGCSGLTSITILDSVTSIGDDAFRNCSGLTSITIPNGVTNIGMFAFEGCLELTEIRYNGTKAQWNSIAKIYSLDYNTGNYTVYCTDGNISKS